MLEDGDSGKGVIDSVVDDSKLVEEDTPWEVDDELVSVKLSSLLVILVYPENK